MKRIVVTGPTGAIGTALIRECIAKDIEVYAIVRPHSVRAARIPEDAHVHLVECDLSELGDLDVSDIPPCDVFYHFGWAATIGDARNDMRLQTDNIRYTIEAAGLAARMGCEAFVGSRLPGRVWQSGGKSDTADTGISGERLRHGEALCRSDEPYRMRKAWTAPCVDAYLKHLRTMRQR